MVWSYTKTKDGFQLLYDTDNPEEDDITGFNINLPFQKTYADIIVTWDEDTVQTMVDGLNNGTIEFNWSPLDYSFKFNLPKDFNIKIKER